jgi:microcystin-dependent protein
MNTAPSGYLKANGALVSRTSYAALFAAIGTTFGAGDGSTTFALPDLRGEFLRGWDDGRGVDAGRVFGSAQADEFKSHTHSTSANPTVVGPGGGPGSGLVLYGAVTTGATGGAETRPRNVALLACIKF